MANKYLDDEKVKRPYSKNSFTEQNIVEIMQCMEDPMYFMRNFMRIQHATMGSQVFNPYPFQERLVDGFHNHRFAIALTARQMGKALTLDTPIPTPYGWTTMGEIRLGDEIYGADGQPARVKLVTDVMHDHRCFEVAFDNGEKIVADADHLWRVEGTDAGKVLTTTALADALVGNSGVYVSLTKPLNTPGRRLPIDGYALGRWLGDRIGIGNADANVWTVLRIPVRSKFIPQFYLRGSLAQRRTLLRGLLESESTVERWYMCEFRHDCAQMVADMRELLSSLGIKSELSSRPVGGGEAVSLFFKRPELAPEPDDQRLYITSVTPVPSVPVRCIQVDNDDHLFLCGRTMVPTHNTTVAVGYLLWKAMFTADTTILIAANKLQQALEIMERVRYAYENLPDYIRPGVTEYNKGGISFDNGSRIVSRATSADAGRGLAITLLYLDEFAHVPTNKAAEFYTSIQPTLSTGGKCIITSTPNSDEDQFAQIWKGAIDNLDEFGNIVNENGEGKNGFFPIKVSWDEHPDRDAAWAKPFRETLGEARFRREFECVAGETLLTVCNPLGQVETLTIRDLMQRLAHG